MHKEYKMIKINEISVLAAFATLKSLADEKKYQNPYQILGEFIRHIIASVPLHSFSAIEINIYQIFLVLLFRRLSLKHH